MKRPSERLQKVFSIISGLSLVFNSILPGATLPLLFASPAYAQEAVTPTPEPTVEPSTTLEATPTAEPTVAPTTDTTPPTTETTTEAPTPTEEETPAPSPEELAPTPTEVTQPTETGPPADGQILDGASTEAPTQAPQSTAAPTPTITSEETEQGTLAAQILENVEADSLDLDSIDPSTSASITTDKADYAPTDTAIITGSGFTPNHSYDLTVKSDDPPATSTTVEITTDDQGTFVYAYQLDGTYRPNYSVSVTNKGGKVIATTTFTDSVLVAPATGGTNISADKAANGSSPAFTTLGAIVITEGLNTDIAGSQTNATLILTAPSGWNFNAGIGSVSHSGSSPGSADIISNSISVTTSTVTVTFSSDSNANKIDVLTISGLQVQATNTSNIPGSGNILRTSGNSGSGSIVGITSDSTNFGSLSQTSGSTPVFDCTLDAQGANDQPGQKDLTQMCVDDSDLPDSISVNWNWDQTGFSGANTGDACSLYDTDGDGLANYAMCVGVANTPAAFSYQALYSCGNDSDSRCTSPVAPITPGAGTNCISSINGTDPFPAGDSYPNDTVASCNIDMDDVGGVGTATLLDVCSYPSGQPNSDPSDCIFYAPKTGKLEVIKQIVPDTDGGLFNLRINGATEAADVSDGGATGEKILTTGANGTVYTVGETAGTSTDLSDYSSTIECKDTNGTGATVASGNNSGPLNVTLNEDDDIVCTITNTLNTATITVNKTLSPTNDPGLFNLQIDGSTAGTGGNVGNNGTTGAVTVLTNSQHTVSEIAETGTSLSNYTTTYSCNNNLSGSGTTVGPFSVTSGQNVTCTFTNTRNTGSVIVNKLVDQDGNGQYEGGNTEANSLGFDWGLDAETPARDMGATATGVLTGAHSVSEDSVTGYHFVGWYLSSDTSKTCANTTNTTLPASITVTNGQATSVTFCNARDTGTLQVLKNVDLNGDGDYTDANETGATDWKWQYNAGSDHNTGDSAITAPTGNYALTETSKTNFHFVNLQCTGGTLTTNSVAVTTGATVVCTFTNARDTGTIQVTKDVVPDDNAATGWDFTITGPTPNSVNDMQDAESSSIYTSMTGSYTVSETAHTGTVAANYDTTYSCSDNTGVLVSGSGTTTSSFTLATGKNVVCTFTNTIKNGTIKVQKNIIGTATDFGFTGDVSGTISTNGGQLTTVDILPGTYTSTESAKTNWDLNSITCDDTTNGGTASTGDANTRTATFNVDPGETVTCTFTNTQRGHIIVDKVTNPTEELQSFDFVATGSGYTNFSLTDVATPNDQSLVPGAYEISETVPTGWDLTNTSCVSSLQDTETAASLELDAGETITCTFTNTQRGSISGVKYEDADGDATTSGDRTVLSGWVIQLWQWVTSAFVDTGLTDTTDVNGAFFFENLLPGVYQLREVLQAGWTKLFPTGGGIDVTLDAGETDEENNFINFENISITACKLADPDGLIGTTTGRTNVAGWQVDLIKNGNTVDDTRVTGANGCYTWTNLGPGDYSVFEETQTGWTNLNPTTHNFGVVQSGETTYSHNFVNTQYGTLIVKKVMVGGEDDFPFTGNVSGTIVTNNGTLTTNNVLPGSYNSVEGTKAVWDLNSITCDDTTNGGTASTGNVGTRTATFNVHAGETVTCTFTNTQRGHLVVQKTTVPAADPNVFAILATGSGTITSGGSGTVTDALDKNYEVTPGTYSVTETVPGNWDETSNDCDDVVVAAGATEYCQIVNTKRGHVTVIKYHDHNANGVKDIGDEVLGDTGVGAEIEATRWEIHLVGTNVNASQWTGAQVTGQVTFSDIKPGTYTVSETVKNGWLQSNITCAAETEIDKDNSHPATVTSGQTTTCSIGNYQKGSISGQKFNDLNSDGIKQPGEPGLSGWTINLDIDANGSVDATDSTDINGDYSFLNLDPDTYRVREVGLAGWTRQTENPTDITLTSGQNVTDIDFGNSRDTGTIIVHKIIDPDGILEGEGATDDQFPGENWEMDADGFGDATDFGPQFTDADGIATFSAAKTGNYNVRELNPNQNGYELLDAYCGDDNGEITNGIVFTSVGADETVNCTFINSPNGSIHGQKWNDLNGDGERERGEPVLAGWKIFLDENDNQTWDEGEQFMLTDGNQELGWYWFEHLFPGTYTVCEEPQAGWVQTSSPQCHTVDVPDGENSCPGPEQLNSTDGSTCDFGNQELDPILTITKENNTGGGDKHPGDSVLYTLTITATQSAAFNVEVTDLLPAGFTYHSGSWTSNSDVRGDLKAGGTTTEPTYASPGVWQLGDMVEDETVTLTYLADISGDQQAGLYFDLAWSEGCKTDASCDLGDALHILSNATNPGFVADNYVGTQVNVIREPSEGVNLEVKGEVLGASTELPATGAQTFWLYIAFALLGGGLSMGALGWFLRRRYE